MTEELNELAALQPESQFVIINDESFEIKPFKFRNMFKVLNHVSNMVGDINPYEDETIQFFRLIGSHEEDVLSIMALAINKPISFFDNVDTEQGLELATVIWKINQDFFVQKIQPKLESLGIKVSQNQSDSQLEKEKNTLLTDTAETENQEPASQVEEPQP